MNVNEIFCPNCHRFIGLDPLCRSCQWTRPAGDSVSIGKLHWQAKIFGEDRLVESSVFLTQITSCGGLLIVPTEDGDITALELETGMKKWTRSLHPDRSLQVQAVSLWNDLLLMGPQNLAELPSYDRSLVAWSAETGEEVWRWPTTADNLSVPIVEQDVAFFSTSEPMLFALDFKNPPVALVFFIARLVA